MQLVCIEQERKKKNPAYSFDFQLVLQSHFALVEPAKLVDLVLVFAAHFQLILPNGCLILP
jgi:hypothetical protein